MTNTDNNPTEPSAPTPEASDANDDLNRIRSRNGYPSEGATFPSRLDAAYGPVDKPSLHSKKDIKNRIESLRNLSTSKPSQPPKN